jgi:hypothetical protein
MPKLGRTSWVIVTFDTLLANSCSSTDILQAEREERGNFVSLAHRHLLWGQRPAHFPIRQQYHVW